MSAADALNHLQDYNDPSLYGESGGTPILASEPKTGAALALEDMNKTPQEIEALAAAIKKNQPPTKFAGTAANVGAGANEFLAGGLGAPVDAVTWLMNKGVQGTNALTGAAIPQIEHPFGGSDTFKSAMGLIGADPRDVTATTWQQKGARQLGADVTGMVAPYMGARALIARGVAQAPTLTSRLINVIGGPAAPESGLLPTAAGAAGNAAVGAGGSLGGQGLESLLPNDSPWRGMANSAGQMVGGFVPAATMGILKAGGNAAIDKARELLGPMFESYRRQQAGETLRQASTDPYALATALEQHQNEIVPGSKQTTFQASGDQGIRELQAQQPQGPFNERLGEQNQARVDALNNLAQGGDPGAFKNLVQQHLAGLQNDEATQVAAAQQNAQQAVDQVGGRLSNQDYGDLMRQQMESAKARSKAQESVLWDAIDPNGTLVIGPAHLAKAATDIVAAIPKTAKPPSGEEKAIFGIAQLLSPQVPGGTIPFRDYTALRGRLLDAIRTERTSAAPDQASVRRMQQLREVMDNQIAGTASVTFDPAAAARYRAAADWTRQQSDQFKNPVIGPLLQERQGMPTVPGSTLPSRLTATPEAMQAFLDAGGSRQTMADSLVADLRNSATTNGILDPAKYARWQRANSDALRMFPEVGRAVSSAESAQQALGMSAATTRQQTVDFQNGAARSFLNMEPAQAVQSVLRSPNPMTDFASLGQMVANNPDAKAGLQRAFADYINNTFITNSEKLKPELFQQFLKKYSGPMGHIFDADQIRAMHDVAADLRQTSGPYYGARTPAPETQTSIPSGIGNRISYLRRIAGQSLPVIGGAALGGVLGRDIHSALEAGMGVAGLEYLMGKTSLGAMRAAGVQNQKQLITDALLNPQVARDLLMTARPANQPFFTQRFVPHMATLGAVSAARAPAQ